MRVCGGVRYGDVGHASLLFLFCVYLILAEKKLTGTGGEVFRMVFAGRYMGAAMGFFGIYAGLIYNDCFAVSVPIFASQYAFAGNASTAHRLGGLTDVYPFGIDPVWKLSTNELLFTNSMKMKMSVIFGVVQMAFGISLKFVNAIHIRSKLDLFAECLPQMIFLIALFGYMVLLILMKWSTDFIGLKKVAPNLVDTLINIALAPGSVKDSVYNGQASVQVVLLLVAFVCVPWMLYVKPYYLKWEHTRLMGAGGYMSHDSPQLRGVAVPDEPAGEEAAGGAVHVAGGGGHGGHGGGHGGEEFSFGEIFIHQAIETIEFVLGTVSNTASYLRLWALSLAHSQLATVFWEKALIATVEMHSIPFVVIGARARRARVCACGGGQ